MTDQPRIYVACLAAYNNGILHGAWIDADDEDTIWQGIRDMLKASPITGAEEWAIHDFEGFGGAHVEEYTPPAQVAALAAFIATHGELGGAVLEHFGGDLDEARAAMEDSYLGEHESLADYMQELTEQSLTIPEALRCYIDWQAMARDAELSGDLFTVSLGWKVHVFASC